jgi:3-dehydroquinate synthase
MRSGLAEMLKHGLILWSKVWEQFLNLKAIDYADFGSINFILLKLKMKSQTIDPRKWLRKHLILDILDMP